jgi:hypothetical protein
VALQGTIDSFDLTEVIRMLAVGEKTGRLALSGDRGSGSLWFADGLVVASDTDTSALAADHAAVLFQLLRFREGSFVFDQGVGKTDAGEALDAEPIIDEAMRLLDEWTEIEKIVPSLRHRIDLQVELSRSDVVIDQACWRAVAAIGGGATVGDLGHTLEQDELDVSRTVKTLVELGLVEVGDEEPVPDGAAAPTPPDVFGLADVERDDSPADDQVELEIADPMAVTDDESGFDAGWLDEAADEVGDSGPVDSSARNQLDALASGFGLTDEPFGTDSAPAEPSRPMDLGNDADEPLEVGGPVPLAGVPENGAGSFPIEEAEAAGEARTPLFAHDTDSSSASVGAPESVQQPGEAAEVARQLANLSPEAARAVAAAARATTEEEREVALALVAEDGDEPLDPDLLRNFLSSVRQ